MNEVMRRIRYGSMMATATSSGRPSTTGSVIRGRFTPPSTSIPAVMASSRVAEPKSGWASSMPTSSTATPNGLSIASQVALTSSRKRTR